MGLKGFDLQVSNKIIRYISYCTLKANVTNDEEQFEDMRMAA